MKVIETWIKGKRVYNDGNTGFSYPGSKAINMFKASPVTEDQIVVKKGGKKIRVIAASDGELLTRTLIEEAGNAEITEPDISKDILKIVVKDRYNDKAPATGFIKGFGLQSGAFASSVAHDSHNIIAVGVDDSSIATCINEIIRIQGGLSVCSSAGVSSLPLPVAGIMSDRPVTEVASYYLSLSEKVRENGCFLKAPFMTLSFMALLVIPELKISDMGLFDGTRFCFIDLFTD
jgi:adenine deaminase